MTQAWGSASGRVVRFLTSLWARRRLFTVFCRFDGVLLTADDECARFITQNIFHTLLTGGARSVMQETGDSAAGNARGRLFPRTNLHEIHNLGTK